MGPGVHVPPKYLRRPRDQVITGLPNLNAQVACLPPLGGGYGEDGLVAHHCRRLILRGAERRPTELLHLMELERPSIDEKDAAMEANSTVPEISTEHSTQVRQHTVVSAKSTIPVTLGISGGLFGGHLL